MTAALGTSNVNHRSALLRQHAGSNAPTATQLVFHLLHELPAEASSRPGSAAFRAAVRDYFATAARGLDLTPTRREVRDACRQLEALGLLPEWVEARAALA